MTSQLPRFHCLFLSRQQQKKTHWKQGSCDVIKVLLISWRLYRPGIVPISYHLKAFVKETSRIIQLAICIFSILFLCISQMYWYICFVLYAIFNRNCVQANQKFGIIESSVEPCRVTILMRFYVLIHAAGKAPKNKIILITKAELVKVNQTPIICLRNFINKKVGNRKN